MELFKKHWLFLLIVSLVLILLQYTPYLYHLSQTPADRVYLGAERYTPDYYVYLFYLNQGAMGRTSVVDFYTNQPHNGSLVHMEYLIAGKLGNLLGLSLPATFYLFRSLTFLIYILISFWFIGLFFKETASPVILGLDPRIHTNKYRIDSRWSLPRATTRGGNDKENKSEVFLSNSFLHKLTFLLSLFWSGVFPYSDFYQPPDLINRLTFEPHKFIGMSLFLVILYVIARSETTKQSQSKEIATLPASWRVARNDKKGKISILTTKYYILLPLLFLAGFFHGITALSLIFTLAFYFLFMFLIAVLNRKNLHYLLSFIFPISLIFLVLSLPLLYWQFVFSQNPVWQAVSLWERHFAQVDSLAPLFPTLIGFIIILGPLILLGSIGLSKFLKEQKNFGLLLLSFLTSNAFLFFLGYIFLGTSKHRFWQTPYLVGWSILAMYGIMTLLSLSLRGRSVATDEVIFKSSAKRLPRPFGARNDKLVLTVYFLLLLFGLPNFKQGLNRELFQFQQAANLDYFAYPPKPWYQSLVWAKTNTDPQSIFLSLPNAGHLIPAIPGRRVFLGDFFHTPGYYNKLPLVKKFYRGQMTDVQAKDFLKQEKVNYVFWGFEEKAQGNLNSYSHFLTPIFDNGEVTIFKII